MNTEQVTHLCALLWAVRADEAQDNAGLSKQVGDLRVSVKEGDDILSGIEKIVGDYSFLDSAYQACLQGFRVQGEAVLEELANCLNIPETSRNVTPNKTSIAQKQLNSGGQLGNLAIAIADTMRAKVMNTPDEKQQNLYEKMLGKLKEGLKL